MTTIHPQDQGEAHAITQAREAQLATIAEVNSGYESYVEAGKSTEGAYLVWANKAREMGIKLQGLKETHRKRFSSLFTTDSEGRKNISPVLCFSQQTGCRFMRIASKHPQPFQTFNEAVRAMREMDETSSRGQQSSRGLLNWLSNFERGKMSLLSILGKEEEKRDITTWKRSEIEALEGQLRPFAEKHQAALRALEVAA